MTRHGDAAKSAAVGRTSGKKVSVRDVTEERRIWEVSVSWLCVSFLLVSVEGGGAYCEGSGGLRGASLG